MGPFCAYPTIMHTDAGKYHIEYRTHGATFNVIAATTEASAIPSGTTSNTAENTVLLRA